MADMYRRAKDLDAAIAAFEKIQEDFEGMSVAEAALFYEAYCNGKKGDSTAAVAAFQEYVDMYPESEDVEYCREQIAKFSGQEAAVAP
jgi:outer membrane protein assembly factor BamD (BamD/ComL family)